MSLFRSPVESILGLGFIPGLMLGVVACGMPPWTGTPGAESVPSTDAAPSGYEEPEAAIVRLLTETPPPTPLVHTTSGQVALLFREPVISLERLARPRVGLAGFRFDPGTRTAGVAPLTERIEVLRLEPDPARAPLEWRPEAGLLLDDVSFSPDGHHLSALLVSETDARLAIFDLELGTTRVLDVPVNPAWGAPCSWVGVETLLCRLVPRGIGAPPAVQLAPNVIERFDEPAPTRTYSNLLESAHEDALFGHYFAVELARVRIDGRVERLGVTPGLIKTLEPSPDGSLAVLTRIEQPFSRLVPASQFPSTVELWDPNAAQRLYASRPSGFGIDSPETGQEDPRRALWKAGSPPTLGYIERTRGEAGALQDRWLVLESPFVRPAKELARSQDPIGTFGWTTAGTPYHITTTKQGAGVEVFVILEDGPRMIWNSSSENVWENPGRAIRVDGAASPVTRIADSPPCPDRRA